MRPLSYWLGRFGIQWSADERYPLLEDDPDDSPIWALSADGSGELEVVVDDGYLLGVVAAWG